MGDDGSNWGDRLRDLKTEISDNVCTDSVSGKHIFASLRRDGEVDIFFCQHCLTYRHKYKGGISSGYPRAHKNT
jgi:hypothetical protein